MLKFVLAVLLFKVHLLTAVNPTGSTNTSDCPIPTSKALNCRCDNKYLRCDLTIATDRLPSIKSVEFNYMYFRLGVTVSSHPAEVRTLGEGDLSSLHARYVDLRRVGVSQLERHAVNSHVTILSLADNRLAALPDKVFVGYKALSSLDLSSNKLKELRAGWFGDVTDGNHGTDAVTSSLTTLNLADNQIERVDEGAFASLTQLNMLVLTGNRLRELDWRQFRPLPLLEFLYLERNRIESIQSIEAPSLAAAPKLRVLDLKGNVIRRISPDAFTGLGSLHQLYLDDNMIDEIDAKAFNPLRSLSYLGLSGHRLTHVKEAWFKVGPRQLGVLNINCIEDAWANETSPGLSIDEEAFMGLDHLSRLYVQRCGLRAVPAAARQLSSLQSLYLSHNRIERVSGGDTAGLSELQQLYLSDNRVAELWLNAVRCMPRLQRLSLDNNRLNCTCRLTWLRDYVKLQGVALEGDESDELAAPPSMTKRSAADSTGVVCAAPASRRKQSVLEFDRDDACSPVDVKRAMSRCRPSAALRDAVIEGSGDVEQQSSQQQDIIPEHFYVRYRK